MCSDLVGKVSQYLRQLAADRASEKQLPGVGENRSPKAKRDYGGGSAIFQPKQSWTFRPISKAFAARRTIEGLIIGHWHDLRQPVRRHLQNLQGFWWRR
jgi:hypothetical protein